MAEITKLNGTDFEQKTASGLFLIDFKSDWCASCRALKNVLIQVADDLAGKATVAEIEVDKEENLAKRFQVRSIPALFIVKDGKTVQAVAGPYNKNSIITALQKWF